MDRLFSGLLSSVRKAASRSTSTGTSSDTLRSPSTSQPKRVTYNAWRAEVEPKIDAVGRLLTSLLQRQERLNEFQAQLKKLNSSLLETDALLSIDIYEVRLLQFASIFQRRFSVPCRQPSPTLSASPQIQHFYLEFVAWPIE